MQTKYSQRFLKEAKNLRKKYRKIDEDILKIVNSIEKDKFTAIDRVKGFEHLSIFKVRIKNSSSLAGKSGGFRIIYYAEVDKKLLYFLTIYSKSEKSDISKNEILKILKDENLAK